MFGTSYGIHKNAKSYRGFLREIKRKKIGNVQLGYKDKQRQAEALQVKSDFILISANSSFPFFNNYFCQCSFLNYIGSSRRRSTSKRIEKLDLYHSFNVTKFN